MAAILYGVGFVMEPIFLCLSENGCNERNSRFLDLCCGAGYNSKHIQNSGYEVVGLDFSEESLVIAREKNPSITFYNDNLLNDYSYIGKENRSR